MSRNKISKETEELFSKHWNNSSNRNEVAIKMNMTPKAVKQMAYALRRKNVLLKTFKSRPYRLANQTVDPTPEQIKERAEKIRQSW